MSKRKNGTVRPQSRRDLTILETNAYNILVESMSNSSINLASSHCSYGACIEKLPSIEASPRPDSKETVPSVDHVTEPVYLELIPHPLRHMVSDCAVQSNADNDFISVVEVKTDVSSSAVSPADGASDNELRVNVNSDQTDCSASNAAQHQDNSNSGKLKESTGESNRQMSSAESEVERHSEQTATTRTDSCEMKSRTNPQLNDNRQDVGGSEVKVTATDLAIIQNNFPFGNGYENISLKTGLKMPTLQTKTQIGGIDNSGYVK